MLFQICDIKVLTKFIELVISHRGSPSVGVLNHVDQTSHFLECITPPWKIFLEFSLFLNFFPKRTTILQKFATKDEIKNIVD